MVMNHEENAGQSSTNKEGVNYVDQSNKLVQGRKLVSRSLSVYQFIVVLLIVLLSGSGAYFSLNHRSLAPSMSFRSRSYRATSPQAPAHTQLAPTILQLSPTHFTPTNPEPLAIPSNWKTYTNVEHRFEMKIPSDRVVVYPGGQWTRNGLVNFYEISWSNTQRYSTPYDYTISVSIDYVNHKNGRPFSEEDVAKDFGGKKYW